MRVFLGINAFLFLSIKNGFTPILNCVAISGSNTINLYVRPSFLTSSVNILTMSLTGVDIFDGNQWNVSFGRFRYDDPSDYLPFNVSKSNISSSYFLRAGRAQHDRIIEKYLTSSFFQTPASRLSHPFLRVSKFL